MPALEQVPESLPWVDDESVVVRTDFTDDPRWAQAKQAMSTPSEPDGFLADVAFVDERRFADLTPEQVLDLATEDWCEQHTCVFIADTTALSSEGWPVLYLDAHGDERGRRFRVIATELWAVENNLSLANMDHHEFADHTDPDGVYRGL